MQKPQSCSNLDVYVNDDDNDDDDDDDDDDDADVHDIIIPKVVSSVQRKKALKTSARTGSQLGPLPSGELT